MSCGFLVSTFKYNKFFRLARMCQKSLLKFNVDMDLTMFYKIIRTMRGSTIIHGSDSFISLDRFISTVNFTIIDVERRMPIQEKKMLIIPSLLSYFYKTGRLKLNSFARSWSAFYTWEATAIDVLVNNEAGGLTISYTTGLNLPTVTWLARPRVPKMIDYPRLLGYHHMFRFNSSWFFSYDSTSYTVLSSMSYNSASVSRTLSILDFLSNRFDNEGLGILYGRSAIVYRSSFFKPWFYTFFLAHELDSANNLLVGKNFFGNFSSFKFPMPDVWNYLIGNLGKVSLDKRVLVKFQDLYRKRFFNYSRWFYSNFLLNQDFRYSKNLVYYRHIWRYFFVVLKKRFRSWYFTFLKLKKYPTVTTQYSFVFYGDFIRQSLQSGCDFEGLSKTALGDVFLTNQNLFFSNHYSTTLFCGLTKFKLLLIKPLFVFIKYIFNLLINFISFRNQYSSLSIVRGFRSARALNIIQLLNCLYNYKHFYRYFLKIIKYIFVFYRNTNGKHFLNQVAIFLNIPPCDSVSIPLDCKFIFNLLAGYNSFVWTYSDNNKNLLNYIKTNKNYLRFKLRPFSWLVGFIKNNTYFNGLINPTYIGLENVPFNSFFSKFILRTFNQTHYKDPVFLKDRKKRLRRLTRRDPIRAIKRFLSKISAIKARKKRILLKLKRHRISDFSIESSLFNGHSKFLAPHQNRNFLRTFFSNNTFLIKRSQYKFNKPIIIPVLNRLKFLINTQFNYPINELSTKIRPNLFINNIISDVNFILLFWGNKNHRRYASNNFDFKNKHVYFFKFNHHRSYKPQPNLPSLLFQQIVNLSGVFSYNKPIIKKVFKFIRFLSKSSCPSIEKITSLIRFLPLIIVVFKSFLNLRTRFFNLKTKILSSLNPVYSYKIFSFGLINKMSHIDYVLNNFNYQFIYPNNLSVVSVSSQKLNELDFVSFLKLRFFIQKILPDYSLLILERIFFTFCCKILKKKQKGMTKFDFKQIKFLNAFLKVLYLIKFKSLKPVVRYLTVLKNHEFFLSTLHNFIINLRHYFFNPKSLAVFGVFIHFLCHHFLVNYSNFRQPIRRRNFFILLNFLRSENNHGNIVRSVFFDLFVQFSKFKNFFELRCFSRYHLFIRLLRLFYIRVLFSGRISYYQKIKNRRCFLFNKYSKIRTKTTKR